MKNKSSNEITESAMKSGIYKGWVRHRRNTPKAHIFKYEVFMMYLDLSELDRCFSGSLLWSSQRPAVAYFRRSDYLGDPNLPLEDCVRSLIVQQCGECPSGAIRVLTNLRYFGYIFNPITCYYVFDENENLRYIVSEVTNTPWKEKHPYVLKCDPKESIQRIKFTKKMHVSPFNPMNHAYHWRSSNPGKHLLIHMENWEADECKMDATLNLSREEISTVSLRLILLKYPFMTLKVMFSIYWQATKLYLKSVPVFDHVDILK